MARMMSPVSRPRWTRSATARVCICWNGKTYHEDLFDRALDCAADAAFPVYDIVWDVSPARPAVRDRTNQRWADRHRRGADPERSGIQGGVRSVRGHHLVANLRCSGGDEAAEADRLDWHGRRSTSQLCVDQGREFRQERGGSGRVGYRSATG